MDAESWAVEALSSWDQKGEEQEASSGSAWPGAGSPRFPGEWGHSQPGGGPKVCVGLGWGWWPEVVVGPASICGLLAWLAGGAEGSESAGRVGRVPGPIQGW